MLVEDGVNGPRGEVAVILVLREAAEANVQRRGGESTPATSLTRRVCPGHPS